MLASSRQQSLAPKLTSLSSLLERVHPLLEQSLKPNVSLSIKNVAEEALLQVDPGQLENCILNLVKNANDAMPEGGEVEIIVARRDQVPQALSKEADAAISRECSGDPETSVVIAVCDTGTGMSDDVKRRAFDPFFTTKSLYRGTGLGLSAVHGFVEQSNGQVCIHSQVGLGTEIYLAFPMARPEEQQNSSIDSSAPVRRQGSSASKSILVVDDNRLIASQVADYFRGNGDVVDICHSGEEGFSLLKSLEYDLLISDIVMPGALDGLALAQASQRLHPKMPILLMTGYSDHKSDRVKDFKILQKPFSRRELSAAAKQSLKRPSEAAP
jgi:CheY-like chemotaxis protein